MTEYIKKHYRLILMSVFAALVCFGYQAFNSNIRIDTEELINHPGSTLGWLTIGRFGLVLLKRMLGLGVHRTIKSGILMLLFFILGGNVLTYGCYYFSGKKDGKPYWIFTLLYMTSNIWSFQFYFSLQQAEVAFAMLLMAVTGFFMCDLCFCEKYKENRSGKDLCKLFLSTVFIVLALGTYQALAVYYIAVCVMFFLLFFWQVNGKREKCGIRIIFLVAHFGISYLIYRGIAGTWFMAAGDYMEGQSNWGSEPAAECAKNVLRVVKNQLLTVGPRNFSFCDRCTARILCDMDRMDEKNRKWTCRFLDFCSRNDFYAHYTFFNDNLCRCDAGDKDTVCTSGCGCISCDVWCDDTKRAADFRCTTGKTGAGQENVPMAAGNGQCGDIACNRSYRRSGLL